MKNGELISKVMAGKAEFEQYFEGEKDALAAQIQTRIQEVKALRDAASARGLRVRKIPYDYDPTRTVEDLSEKDDSDRLVDTIFKIHVKNIDEAKAAVAFCKELNYMALPVGAKTSALGVFDAVGDARTRGLNGAIGIQIDSVSFIGRSDPDISLKIPKFSSEQYELVTHPKGFPVAVLKSKNFPKVPHRVIAYAGVHINDVNKFLNEAIPDAKHSFRLMANPTSLNEAQLGGVISTGAEGGNRAKAADDIFSCTTINADGNEVCLDKEQSEKIIGSNGAGGLVVQADFEVTAFPKNEYGVFIPIRGHGAEAMRAMFMLQQQLVPYCQPANGDPRLQVGSGETRLIVTGIEPLSKSSIETSTRNGSHHDFDVPLNDLMKDSQYGVYVTFSTDADLASTLSEDFFLKLCGLDEGEIPLGDDGNTNVPNSSIYERFRILQGEELERMDSIRHGAPSHSRERAKELGDQTQSSDLNIRFTSDDESENTLARNLVADLYQKYSDSFGAEDGFQVMFYGHLHPGVGVGGGVDPHVRVIFELSNLASRYNAPEQVIAMKKKQRNLYRDLLALDGKHGIKILCPEKSRFTNNEYWNWLCLHDPEDAREYLRAVVKHGYSSDGRPIIGARIPHEMPGIFPRIPGAIKSVLNGDLAQEGSCELERWWPAILEISQFSHRGPEVMRLVGEVTKTIQEKFKLSENQYSFFLESEAEARAVIERNFGKKAEEFDVKVVCPNSLEQLNEKICPEDEKTFYIVDLSGLGIKQGLTLLVSPHEAVKLAYELTVEGKNKAAFRNLYDMWAKWPYETEETPNTVAIASLGVVLQENEFSAAPGFSRKHRAVSVNPGPAQRDEAVYDGAADFFNYLSGLDPVHVIEMFKKFVCVPPEHRMAFFTSATQAMQVVAEAVAAHQSDLNVIQVSNDVFSEKFYSVLASEVDDVHSITTPWTSSENSQIDRVVDQMVRQMDAEPDKVSLIFVTPHKTSTTADFSPDILIRALKERGKIIGRDFDLICDLTSAIGARDYATVAGPDDADLRMSFNGMFGAMQKGLTGLPGLGFLSLSPKLANILTKGQSASSGGHNLASRIEDADCGTVVNPVGLCLLGQKLEAEAKSGRTVADIQAETKKKTHLVLGWLERHPDLMLQVQDSLDQSPILLGIFSQSKNLVVAKRLLADIFGYYLGSGYGPFSKEAIRLYLPNIAYEDLQRMLGALDLVLGLEDVVQTRGETVPNIGLREPHSPLSVIERLSKEFTVDDIFEDVAGLHWIERLIRTFNANVSDDKKKRVVGVVPEDTAGFVKKAKIYGLPESLEEMGKILDLCDDDEISIIDHYTAYLNWERLIRNFIEANPQLEFHQGDSMTVSIGFYLAKARLELESIAKMLRRYVRENATPGAEVMWPLVA